MEKSMRNLLLLVFLVSLFSCNKDKDVDSLPKPLKDIIANTRDCTCKYFIDKYQLVTDNPPQTEVLYIMSCDGVACSCASTIYDENGEPTTLPPTHHLEFVKRIWSC